MPLTALEASLRKIARERIGGKLLPCEMPSTVWAGAGTHECCSLCDRPIKPDDVEFEYEFDGRPYHFHRICNGIWQLECERTRAIDGQRPFDDEAPLPT